MNVARVADIAVQLGADTIDILQRLKNISGRIFLEIRRLVDFYRDRTFQTAYRFKRTADYDFVKRIFIIFEF
ncbi:hypothetical protein D9M72_455730 [compost metagenome]